MGWYVFVGCLITLLTVGAGIGQHEVRFREVVAFGVILGGVFVGLCGLATLLINALVWPIGF